MDQLWDGSDLTEIMKTRIRVAVNLTSAKRAHPEHALIGMLEDPESHVARCCAALKPGLNPAVFQEVLVTRASSDTPTKPVDEWSDSLLSDRFRAALSRMQAGDAWVTADASMRDQLFSAEIIAGLRASYENTLSAIGIDRKQLEEMLRRPPHRRSDEDAVLSSEGDVNLKAFDRPAQDILRLMETEGRGLGLKQLVSSLMLFALASSENGVLSTGLRLQAPTVQPHRFRENLALHTRSLGSGRLNDAMRLHRDDMQPSVIQSLHNAAGQADLIDAPNIGEPELLQGLLLSGDSFVESFFHNERVNLKELSTYVAQRRSTDVRQVEEEGPQLLPVDQVEERLRTIVLGQDHAIDSVMPMIKRLRFGYLREGRPAGVLLLLGMSGTGKTALAREIARAVYGSEENLIFLEMGQFGSEHSKTSFVGAPPGLVGYGEGILTNGLRDHPESVVLFDEVEKAHKSVFDVVLRFLDEGQIADAAGAVRDGRRCIIVLTSNLGVAELTPLIREQSAAASISADDRGRMRQQLRERLEAIDFFRPEFINRVDELILFNEITPRVYLQIVRQQLSREQQRLRDEKQLDIQLDPAVAELIADRCAERSREGARVCGRMISDLVVTPLIDFFLQKDNENAAGARITVNNEHEINFSTLEAST